MRPSRERARRAGDRSRASKAEDASAGTVTRDAGTRPAVGGSALPAMERRS